MNEFSRVPKHDDLWMVYFNINDTKFARMLAAFCRVVAERLDNDPSKCVACFHPVEDCNTCNTLRRYIILAPETATISMAHVLRLQYGFDVQLIGKKQRPNAKPDTLSDTYHPITGGTAQTIYFNGFDEGIDVSSGKQVIPFVRKACKLVVPEPNAFNSLFSSITSSPPARQSSPCAG